MKHIRILIRAAGFALKGKFWISQWLIVNINVLSNTSLGWVNGSK